MVQTEMGRYWEQTKRWFLCKVWSFKTKKGRQTEVSKCVPLAKATRMTESQRASAVKRKRAVAQGVGGKPTNVATFAKRSKKADGGSVGNSMIKQAQRDYRGTYISGDLGGVEVSNPSLRKYYKGML